MTAVKHKVRAASVGANPRIVRRGKAGTQIGRWSRFSRRESKNREAGLVIRHALSGGE